MSFILRESLEIAAPNSVVWNVITDLGRYSEWNPFVVEAASSLVIGHPIDMKVQLLGSFAQRQRETIFENVEGERLSYGLREVPLGAIRSQRCHQLRPLDGNRTEYSSCFELAGWLSPLTTFLLASQLERGFSSMTRALKNRAESLHRG